LTSKSFYYLEEGSAGQKRDRIDVRGVWSKN